MLYGYTLIFGPFILWHTTKKVEKVSIKPIREALDRVALDKAIYESLPLFSPMGAGLYKDLAELTIISANQTLPLMAYFAGVIGVERITEMKQAKSLCVDSASIASAEKLKKLFDSYESDKSTSHEYHYIYGSLFKNADTVTSVLEVGIGTNNASLPSNMSNEGKPGASLRAFRDYFTNANVYGADIDKDILFEENRIKTFYVDQTVPETLYELGKTINDTFDLIIDDGLHSPNANIAVLTFGIKKLKPNGWLVIEDIKGSSLPVWQIIAALLPAKYQPYLITDKFGSGVFMINNCSSES